MSLGFAVELLIVFSLHALFRRCREPASEEAGTRGPPSGDLGKQCALRRGVQRCTSDVRRLRADLKTLIGLAILRCGPRTSAGRLG